MRFALVAALALLGCSRSHGATSDGGVPTPIPSTAGSATPTGKAFGAYCVEDRECASAVCFHKRLEHDGYCSMSCNSDGDCPTPPTNGRCGARGMCKRPQ